MRSNEVPNEARATPCASKEAPEMSNLRGWYPRSTEQEGIKMLKISKIPKRGPKITESLKISIKESTTSFKILIKFKYWDLLNIIK